MPDSPEPLKELTSKKPDSPEQGASALPTVDASETQDFTTASISSVSVGAPRSIGPYRLIRRIGEGGMGQVWLAQQTSPLQRQVALKLIRAGMYDDSMLRRFQSERQSLAMMNHPCIAKVFDAGATPDGQPYFVMEYVPGQPITRYCDEKKLKIRERLELFIAACDGVQHAHQKAVIHRDLKPANILVVEVDGKPTPRIIDFGLAKALDPSAAGDVFATRIGGFVGTPGFMSPEQADPSVVDVDTRTDVYSLGMILYVLLTGTLPFDTERWKTKPFDAVLKELREEEAPSPSAKLATQGAEATATAENRGTEPRHLVKLLRGDLDWIAMKAIEKDRTRRYGTPSELAADIRRHLANEPVVASPASPAYRLRKYVRRHRIGVGVAATLLLLLTAFAGVQAAELRRITRERDRANRITDFMTSMFKVSDPSESRGNTITAREILDKASNDIDKNLTKDPDLQGQMMHVMGTVYLNLGLYRRAETLLTRAVDVRTRTIGTRNADTLASMDRLAWTLHAEGRYTDAERILREVVPLRSRVLGSENPGTVESTDELAWVLDEQNRFTDGEKLQRQVLAIRLRTLGSENLDTASAMMHLANSLLYEGRLSEAESLFSQALDIRRHLLGGDSMGTVAAMLNLGVAFQEEGKYSDAVKLNRQIVDIERRVLGPEHPATLHASGNLAWCLAREGRWDEAEKLQRETVATERRVLGPEHPQTLGATGDLASTLSREGKLAEAEQLQRETLEIQRRVLGPEKVDTLATANNLANTLMAERHLADSEKLLRETLEIRRRVSGPENPNTLSVANNLSGALRMEGKYAEAEKLLQQTLEVERRVLPQGHPETATSLYGLACVAAQQGHKSEAFSLLGQAVEQGLPVNGLLAIEKENDLKSLRGDPRFAAIVSEARQRAAAAQRSQ